ncbi:hypothetical protein [Neobacillus niacini]|uniref:hypothetical protein n=1 Tax=Neobacillus niacini TaxID=86668 RepID=UPI002862681A|nr:hypothetical protein [Neobacillus niacini]MDR7001570.1 hypothetical protein [Neobacillus niacini]
MPKRVVIEEVIINGEIVLVKECSKCKEKKPLTEFTKLKTGVGGRRSDCVICRKAFRHTSEQREKERHNSKRWRDNNKDKTSAYQKMRSKRDREKYLLLSKKYYDKYRKEISEKRFYYRNLPHNKSKEKERLKRYYLLNKETYVLRNSKRRTLEKKLPNTVTNEQLNEILYKFNGGCALTGEQEIHWDHVIPLATGHCGTIYGNMIPLRNDLNLSKNDSNVFEWFYLNKGRYNLSQDKFDSLVCWLSEINRMTVPEYVKYVYDCHADKNETQLKKVD